MPEPTPNKTASKLNEEQIVNRIVELLNEKGYEYERDARPIICWKFGVQSSRELTLNQKKEVKESLENGIFEKWGMEYKEQVLDKQMDIVKEIEKLHGAPADIKIDSDRNVAVVEDKKTQSDKAKDDKKSSKNSDVEMLKPKKDQPKKKSDTKLINASNLKIDIPADKKETSKNETKTTDEKSTAPKIDLKSSKISLKKPSEKADKQDSKPVDKVEPAKEAPKLKTLSSAKEDTKVVKPPENKKDEKEVSADKPHAVNLVKQEKSSVAQPPKEVETKENTVVEQDVSSQEQDVDAPKGKRYRLTTRSNSENNTAMGLEEAEKIVKNKFSDQVSEEEFSVATVSLVFMSLSFLTFSIYTNYLLFFDKNFPDWLVFVCEMFR